MELRKKREAIVIPTQYMDKPSCVVQVLRDFHVYTVSGIEGEC